MNILLDIQSSRIKLTLIKNCQSIMESDLLYENWLTVSKTFISYNVKENIEECWYLQESDLIKGMNSIEDLSNIQINNLYTAGASLSNNDLYTVSVINFFTALFPKSHHRLISDKAFFSALPDDSLICAIPSKFRKSSFTKRGGFGLTHKWIADILKQKYDSSISKIISIYLGDKTNITAIQEGQPIETSIGFSSAEGLPSMTGCGDIDPTMLMELHAYGMEIHDIVDLIENKSGICGYLGRNINFREFLKDTSEQAVAIREVYFYQIIKFIGYYMAILGGIDAIAIVSDAAGEDTSMITYLCEWFNFMGIKTQSPEIINDNCIQKISLVNSSVSVYYTIYDKIKILSDLIEFSKKTINCN